MASITGKHKADIVGAGNIQGGILSSCSVNSYHLMNTVRERPGVYSCAIDSFIELCFYNLYPVLANLYPHLTPFLLMIHDCCKKYSQHTLTAVPRIRFLYELLSIEVRQPIWDFIIHNCNSFRNRDPNAQFSEIFRHAVFGQLNVSEIGTFISRCTFDRFCHSCNIKSPGFEEILLHYVDCSNPSRETVTDWPLLLVNFKSITPLCPSCNQNVVTTNFFIEPSVVLFIEFSPNLMDIVEYHEDLMLHEENYKLCGVVRNSGAHFSIAVRYKNIWIYIDDLKTSKEKFTSFTEVKNSYPNGWFFCCFINSKTNIENIFSLANSNQNVDVKIDFEITSNKNAMSKMSKVQGNDSKRRKLEKNSTKNEFKGLNYFHSAIPSLEFPIRAKRLMTQFYHYFDKLKIDHCSVCKEAWFDISKGVCTRCKRDKLLPKKFSAENFMIPSPVPPELQGLTQVEEMLIARAFPIMNIYCKSRGGQRAYKGHVITMPSDVQIVANRLPNLIEDLPIIRLSSSDGNHKSKDFRVRRQKVLCALEWLVRFNPCYLEINIDHSRLEQLPIDGLVNPVRQITLKNEEEQLPVDRGPLQQLERDDEMSTFLPVNLNSRKQKDVILEASVASAVELDFVGESPLNEFSTEFLATMAFPTLFPDGKGDPTNSAIVRDISNSEVESFALKIKHLLKFGEFNNGVWNYRFTAHPRFCYWAFNILYRKRILSKGNLYVKRNPGDVNFTFDEFNEMVSSNSSNLFKKMFYYTKELTGSNSYWNRVRQNLRATIEQVGAPTIFFTLSMAEFHWPDLRRLFNLSENSSSQDLMTMIKDNPHIVVWYFQHRTEKFVKYWLYEYLGATWHWFRYEFAALRGSVHCHGLAKLKNDPGLVELSKIAVLGHIANEKKSNDNTEENLHLLDFDIQNGEEAEKTICEYVDNLLTTVNPIEPSLWSSPKVHPCKRDFSSLKSKEVCSKDHVELVNSVQKHTCSTLYCLRQRGNELVCRFKFPFEECVKTHLQYTKVHTKDSSVKYRVEVKTARNDPRLNRYQRVQLQGWRANCDLSVIVDYQSCLEYLTKYASKPECMSTIVRDALRHVSNSISEADFDSIKTVKKLMMQAVGLRDMSVQEVCHQLLRVKLHSSSFEVITASLDGSRRIENLDGEFVNHLSHLDIYSSRNELSNFDVRNLNFMDFHSSYCYKSGKITKRKTKVIVRTVPRVSSYPKGVDYGKYCKLQLIKFKVWSGSLTSAWSDREPCDDNFIQEWRRFLQSEYARTSVPDYSFELDNLQIVLCQEEEDENEIIPEIVEREEWMLLSELSGGINNEEHIDNIEHSFDQEYWLDISAQYSHEELLDMTNWINTKKSTFIIESNNNDLSDECENISKLNVHQRKVFDIVTRHSQNNQCEQLLMIITGKAGSGKSFLIDRLRNALGERCQVSAMFGIAAFNVKGKTLHYLLKLPIRGKRKKDLNGEPLAQIQEHFETIEYLIIDEYSVISQSDLAWINRRCKQATGQQKMPFGGINIILFGDLGQLPPVMGSVLYSNSPNTELDCEGMFLYSLFEQVVVLERNQRISGEDSSNNRFSKLLDNVRDGTVTESDWKLLLRHTPLHKANQFTGALRLSYGTKEVAEQNFEALKKLKNPIAVIKAVHNKAEAAKCSLDDMEGLAPSLLLSVGARVMLTRNLWTDVGLVNGALGVVHSILYQQDNFHFPAVIIVKFDKYTGPSFFLETPSCVPIPPSSSFSESHGPAFERTQYPLKLAWAITIHKSQGLTLDQAWIDLGSSERSLGMSYVALSRVRCLDDILIEPMTFQRLNSIGKAKNMQARKHEQVRLSDLSLKTSF